MFYFWLVDVKSTVISDGNEVALDYINTCFDEKSAIKMARKLVSDKRVLSVSVHKWKMDKNGNQDHTGEIIFSFDRAIKMCNISGEE